MTLPLVVILILVATCLFRLRHRVSAWIVSGVTAIVFLLIGCGLAPSLLLSYLQAPYATSTPLKWEKHNAIVLLGMGTEKVTDSGEVKVNAFAYGRVARTAMLYRSCKESAKDCKVIISGGDARGYGKSEAAVYGDDLMKLGVAASDLVLEDRSMNTWQNAQFTSALLLASKTPFDRVWLVSSAVHLTRSILYFAHFGTAVTPVPADYLSVPIMVIPVAYNFMVMDIGLHEALGVLRTRLYNTMGWNISAERPGAL